MRAISWTAVACLAVLACGNGEPDDRTRFEGEAVEEARRGWPEGLAALVDSGNVAYREGRFDEAARLFERGTREFPHQGAVWFGLYMAEHARGNVETADSALVQAERLTPGLAPAHGGAPPDTGAPADTPRPVLPSGH